MIDDFVRMVDEAIGRGEIRMVFWTHCNNAQITWEDVGGKSIPTCSICGEEGPPQ